MSMTKRLLFDELGWKGWKIGEGPMIPLGRIVIGQLAIARQGHGIDSEKVNLMRVAIAANSVEFDGQGRDTLHVVQLLKPVWSQKTTFAGMVTGCGPFPIEVQRGMATLG